MAVLELELIGEQDSPPEDHEEVCHVMHPYGVEGQTLCNVIVMEPRCCGERPACGRPRCPDCTRVQRGGR